MSESSARRVASAVVAAPKAVAVGFFRGLSYPFRGMKLVFLDHPSLVRFWIFPIVLTLLVLFFVMKGVWDNHDAFVALFWDEPSGDGWLAAVGRFFHGVVEVLVAILGFVAGIVVVYLLTSILAAPFNDALSEEVERIAAGKPGVPFSIRVVLRDAVRTILLEAAKAVIYLVIMVPLFVASLLVPVVGQILYTVIGFLFTAVYWAVDYVDWPASRRNRGIGHRFGLAFERFLPMFGFGTGVWLFLFVPFLNLLFMPAAVAGGTLLYLDLEAQAEAEAKAREIARVGESVGAGPVVTPPP